MTNIRGTHNIVVVESGQGIAAALICSLCWNIMHHIHNAIKLYYNHELETIASNWFLRSILNGQNHSLHAVQFDHAVWNIWNSAHMPINYAYLCSHMHVIMNNERSIMIVSYMNKQMDRVWHSVCETNGGRWTWPHRTFIIVIYIWKQLFAQTQWSAFVTGMLGIYT